MKKLLLAGAMAAGLAAPAFAQSAVTNQPENVQYSYGAPRMEAQNVMRDPAAPPMAVPGVPGAVNSELASQQAYQAGLGNPRDWKASNPNNYQSPGG
jgi:hypothetical protein